MLEGLAAWVLNTYVGEYVENLNTDQLSIALLQGAVELDNLPLKKSALKSLGLPLEVKSGFIGKITLQIPLRRLHSEPWVISIEKLYLVAGPKIQTEYDEEKEKAAEEARKAQLLEALEAKYQVQTVSKQGSSSWFSYGTSVLANILENLQLKIKDVHIRYEDDVTNPACPFAFGVVIKALSAQSTDASWIPKFVSRDNVDLMHKLVDLQNFSLYFDTNTTLVGEMSRDDMDDYLQREMYISSLTNLFKEHEYILSPTSGTAKMKRHTTLLPLRDVNTPRNMIDLNLEGMAFSLSEQQYRNMYLILREFSKHRRRKKYLRWRPNCPVINNAKRWWKFAIDVHMYIIQDRNRRSSKQFVMQRVVDNVLYTQIYTAHMKKEVLTTEMKNDMKRIEEELSFDELKILRDIVHRKLKEQGFFSKAPSPEPEKPVTSPVQEDKTVLQRWFPGWGGWYGTQPQKSETEPQTSDECSPSPAKISKVELEQELQDVMDVMGDGGDDSSVLTRDAVFAKLNFCLDTGSFKVLGTKLQPDSGDMITYSIMELECTGIEMGLESRPRTSGLKFGLGVGGLVLNDKMTENSLFPCLVSSQNKERLGHKKQPGGFTDFQKAFRIPTVQEDSSLKLFELVYEKNPLGKAAKYKFSMKTKPLDMVYNKDAFDKLKDIFSSKNVYQSRRSETHLTDAARRQYETIKRQTQTEFKNSFTRLIQGTDEEQIKRWDIQLDISAPQIIIPENFQTDNTSMVVLDLGNLKFHNTTQGTPSSHNDDDEFLTPMSTPPNEPSESATKTLDLADLSQMNLTESEFYSKLYDQYTLDLTDLQVMVGKMKDNWRHIHHRGSTPLHLVDRFTISLQLERRLVFTTDPQWPTVTVSGTLPSLTVHVNEHKIQTMNSCIKSLSKPSTSHTATVNQSSSSQSLTESSSGLNLEDTWEVTQDIAISKEEESADQKLKELLEESHLVRMQFLINQMSFEIHSRERPVAELQVSGVRSNLTKRPYDTAVTLTVHSLLVVDALQTYGQDFELLVASHKNIALDNTSGSICDSATTSPMALSPGSPPSSPLEQLPPTSGVSGIQAVQDVVSRAFQSLIGDSSTNASNSQGMADRTSPYQDSEALITLEFEMIDENSPSNTNTDGPLNIATFQFNNLDIIANQETIVEILGFLKRAVPKGPSSQPHPKPLSDMTTLSKSTNELLLHSDITEGKPKLEVTAEFNRLSVLLMKLDEVNDKKVAKKIATATMCSARVQATIDSELNMSGSLGGFHVFDISPDVQRYSQMFSVGQNITDLNGSHTTFTAKDMYKTAHESILMDELASENRAFSFSFSKPLSRKCIERSDSPFLDPDRSDKEDCIKLSLKVASLCYTHSPKAILEISQCVSAFKDYRESVAKSIKSVASEVAKGIVAKRSELGNNSQYGSMTSLDMFTGNKYKANQSADGIELEYLEGTAETARDKKYRIVLDASFDSPAIIVPKSATSSKVLVAHLGQITVNNTEKQLHEQTYTEDTKDKSDRIAIEMRNINLYAVDTDKQMTSSGAGGAKSAEPKWSFSDGSLNNEAAVPIMYDTLVQVTVDHFSPSVINQSSLQNLNTDVPGKESQESAVLSDPQFVLDIKAKIQTPVKLVLSKNVYEQILQTSDYISSADSQVGNTYQDQDSSNIPKDGDVDTSDGVGDAEGDNISDTPSLESPRNVDSSSSLSVVKFVTKKFKFEVPLFSVELRGDFGEGEQGIVELKLHQFLLNYLKSEAAVTKVDVSLKSISMDDLLVTPDSPHRQIMVSRSSKKEDLLEMPPKEFLSQSCPDNAIMRPVPIMPHSLPSNLYNEGSTLDRPIYMKPFHGEAFLSSHTTRTSKIKQKSSPSTPPPSPQMSRSMSCDEIVEERLVYVSLLLVDKASPEYKLKYNETKRFVDVDFSCLETKINQQTWVVLLDFLGLGAKVHDVDILEGKATSQQNQPVDPDMYVQAVVNSEINFKVENLSIILNKQEYQFAEASISKLSSHVSLRDGNFNISGQLGSMAILDLSPSGQLYRERFLTIGQQALEFDFFKYGVPDPMLKRDFDMRMKVRMASVRYTHTNKFQAEMLGFIQQFLQLQDILGRMRAASAGKKINEMAFHNPRLLLDIEAGSPIILIPHSSRTSDVLVADLGRLSVKNVFKFDGDPGTFNEKTYQEDMTPTSEHVFDGDSSELGKQDLLSRSNSQTSQRSTVSSRGGIISSRSSVSQLEVSQGQGSHPLTQGLFEDLSQQRLGLDPMTASIYGGLDLDMRSDEEEIYDPTDVMSEGSSVDPSSPRSGSRVSLSSSAGRLLSREISNMSQASSVLDESFQNAQSTTLRPSIVSTEDTTLQSSGHRCLLDMMEVQLTDMDLFSAERVEKRHYKGRNLQQDLEFPSCVIQRQGTKLLKEKCVLNLKIERNLDGDRSHAVPDFRIEGSLSSVYCCLDIVQYKLIRGLLDHNLGEKFEPFKKELITSMQDPKIQTVLSGDVWTVIAFAVNLNNVTIELLTSHADVAAGRSEVSLAKVDLVRSRLSYESYSDQSKETDLVSHEILASDTRFRDVAINQRPSVFEKILTPGNNANPDCLQMELHFRSTPDGTRFMVILNNMKLICSFDWMIGLQEFIGTKPENPFVAGQEYSEPTEEPEVPRTESPTGKGSRTTSPVTTSGGIITKRGPIVEQTEVPFEFKLNVTDTQFVMVENLASMDSSAVILKCTSVLSYRPKASDKLLSCTLQSLEIFSCSLQAEEETALSIVDPMSITIELNANPLPSTKLSTSAGLLDATVVEQKQLLLEASFNTMNVRLSYQDMKLFLAIMDSLPKQALQAKRPRTSPISGHTEGQLNELLDLGFNSEDCLKALKMTNNDVQEAAVWLTENCKIQKPKQDNLNITQLEFTGNNFCLCLIDDCQDADVPLVELNFNGLTLKNEPGMEGKASCLMTSDYYNRKLSGWEPLIEPWRCQAQWKNFKEPEKKLAVEISASEVLNINITETMLDLYNQTKDTWTEDYYKQKEDTSPRSGVRKRQMFTPYVIRNYTGSPISFIPNTVNLSMVGADSQRQHGQRSDESAVQSNHWTDVAPNEEVPFQFLRHEKIRHKKSNTFRVNQLQARVEGWQTLTPLSVDKEGIYFRDTLPDVSRPSIIKVNNHQKARVVFDITQEGSARKVITLRSALMVSNRLDGPIEVKMDNPIIPGRYDYITVNSNQQKPIPMPFVGSRLWVRPTDWMVDYCNDTIQWQHVSKPGKVHATVRTCEVSGSKESYRFCVAVQREKYPEEARLEHGLSPLPGHTLIILPPATIKNLLPIDLRYYLKGTQICGEIKPGKEAQLHSADISTDLELGINLENFPVCKELTIPPGTSRYKVKLRLYDTDNRLLELHVKISTHIGGSLKLTISAPFWLVNRSGLPLVFRQDSCKMEAAGQFEEHEMARVVSPLVYSFVEKDSPYLCSMRIGRYKHERSAIPQWCRSFAFDKEATVCQLHVASKEGNRPDWVYSIGINVKQGQGQLRNTTIVKFVPRFRLENQSEHKLAVAQRHFTNKEALKKPDGHLTALAGCIMPFHWPRQDLDQLLCIKLLDVEDCNWSGGFRIDSVNSFHVNMRDCRKNSILLKVEVLLQGQTYHILFSDAEETPPPFRLDNMSEVPLLYYQTKTQEENLRAVIRPQTCLSYTWDEPTLEPYLTLSVANGTTATYDLNKLGEGEQLSYQNFIYISATSTFSRSGDPYTDFGHRELVLDCEHDNHVVFKKKESGKRSQLWRMTSDGMLEHEGLGQPIDPRSTTKTRSGQRYVLDIADIGFQPGKPVPLALKKADKTRVAKQTWVFKNGILGLTTGNFCVQCLNGEEGLQDGAIAMLGPGCEGSPIPKHMSISSQKLHPGSGCLTVRVIMDGPVRVLQINDISQRSLIHRKQLDTEDWEVYEESLNHKTNAKQKKPVQRNIELDLNLKGGIGVSLVNSVPEELVYVVLKNITLHYRSFLNAETVEMTVADIQADNQLISSSHTALLFVTPTTQKDVVENTHALLISAHKIPNVSWNAEIYKHFIISMKKLTMQLEEELLWKLVQFFGLGQVDQGVQKLQQGTDDLQTALSGSTSVKQKRFYFGQLKVKPTCITLSVLTSSSLPSDLLHLKRSLAVTLVNFEDAKVDLDAFNRKHLFETKDFFVSELKNHYKEELKGQAAKILGSVDFLGNPLGLVNDVAEGVSGLIEDVNVGGFAKGIFHGVSNSTAKVAGSVSDVVSNVHLDSKHNTKRQQIRNKAQSSGGHIMSGFKGLGHGVYGGIKSVFKPIEGAREGGIEGFAMGLYEGLVGVVTKPVAGVLDLASGMSGAVRDASRRSSHMQPPRLRETRCCHGPGGLLPVYSKRQAKTQDLLYTLNDHCYSEIFIAAECLRKGQGDSLYALITNHQVFFLKALDRHKENIIMNIKHSDYFTCRQFELDGRNYIEIWRKEKSSSVPQGSIRKPQIRCDKKEIAVKVAQQLNYAKNLYDEQMWTLASIVENGDED